MKKRVLLMLIVMFQGFTILGQNNRVIYKVGLIENQSKDKQNISVERKKFVSDVKENLSKLECELIYNKNTSLFRLVDKLDIDTDNFALEKAKSLVGNSLYKNLLDTIKLEKVEFNNKKYYIKKENEFKWNITGESKIINNYVCYKATSNYEEYDSNRQKQLTFTPEIWFTPLIPASFGPIGLDGLPGLVLEGRFNERVYFYTTKIEFNISINEDQFSLEKNVPIITQKEYDKIMLEHNNELKNN